MRQSLIMFAQWDTLREVVWNSDLTIVGDSNYNVLTYISKDTLLWAQSSGRDL
ncbi:MAG: hypothetical protein PUP92_20615 [Rhizonema sp. PD38]|nr:hypothetical protein [Rhizonema sp. PD38]